MAIADSTFDGNQATGPSGFGGAVYTNFSFVTMTSCTVTNNSAANGGGIGVLATDGLIERGGRLAELEPTTIEALDRVLPRTWSHGNPVDIIGDAPPGRYLAAVEAVAADPGVDALLVMNCPTALASPLEAAKAVAGLADHGRIAGKPAIACWLGEETARAGRAILQEAAALRLAQTDASLLQYGWEQGDGYFRHALANFLSSRYHVPVEMEHLFVSAGASQALDLICTLYTQPGDVIFVEEPTYFLALRIFADHRLVAVPIALGAEMSIGINGSAAQNTQRASCRDDHRGVPR